MPDPGSPKIDALNDALTAAGRALDEYDGEALAVMVVAFNDALTLFRAGALEPAKVRLGAQMADAGAAFYPVGDRIVEASWSSVKREWATGTLLPALAAQAVTQLQLNAETGEIETPAQATARIFAEVFPTTNPRTTALDRYLPGAKQAYATVVDSGHATISIRRPGGRTRRTDDE